MEIIGVIASVVKTKERLSSFCILLDSIRNQTSPLDGLIISCFVDPALGVDPTELFSRLGKNCHILLQKTPKLQFLQFKDISSRLNQKFPSFKNKFLLFSDDDDIWNVNRVECNRQFASNEVGIENVHAFISMESTLQRVGGCRFHDYLCQNVDAMINCGCTTFTNFPEATTPMLVEYHYFMVRDIVLADFVRAKGWIVEQNRFADMEFRIFISKYNTSVPDTIRCFRPIEWTYFYRYSHDSVTATRAKTCNEIAEICVERSECPTMQEASREILKNQRLMAKERGCLKEFDQCLIECRNRRKQKCEKEYNEKYLGVL